MNTNFTYPPKTTQKHFNLGDKFDNRYLTKREFEVLKFVVMSYSSKQIACLLGISFRTVECYIETLKLKLNCNKKGDIARTAIETKLILELGIF